MPGHLTVLELTDPRWGEFVARHSRWLGFGRTDAGSEGLRAFKQSWGAAEESLIYSTLVISPESASARDGMADHLLASVIRHGPLVVSCHAPHATT
jgi:hypothetical protein